MKLKLFFAALLATISLFASGCATRATASGGRETSVLGGAVTVSTNSFEPTNAATVDADTSKIISRGNPSGSKTTLFWGLITLHDY
jgi:hypothetical protein